MGRGRGGEREDGERGRGGEGRGGKGRGGEGRGGRGGEGRGGEGRGGEGRGGGGEGRECNSLYYSRLRWGYYTLYCVHLHTVHDQPSHDHRRYIVWSRGERVGRGRGGEREDGERGRVREGSVIVCIIVD